jgi:CheY-like chemotaxis protein
MRILVVEDDPVLSDGLRVGLSLFGATLDTVSSCADGRAAVALTDFDALVLDLMLPDGSGLDLLRELRASGDRTPILLLTALNEVADRIKGLDAGADDYLGKPFRALCEWCRDPPGRSSCRRTASPRRAARHSSVGRTGRFLEAARQSTSTQNLEGTS